MNKLISYDDFLNEKKSPYKKETLLKYKKEFEAGEEIPVGIENSLKAQGLIPRADGEIRVSPGYEKSSFFRVEPKKKVEGEELQRPKEKEKENIVKPEKKKKIRKKEKLVKESIFDNFDEHFS